MQKVDTLWQTKGQTTVKVCSEMQRLISPVLAGLKDPEY